MSFFLPHGDSGTCALSTPGIFHPWTSRINGEKETLTIKDPSVRVKQEAQLMEHRDLKGRSGEA
jgi:hypothetical protein